MAGLAELGPEQAAHGGIAVNAGGRRDTGEAGLAGSHHVRAAERAGRYAQDVFGIEGAHLEVMLFQ